MGSILHILNFVCFNSIAKSVFSYLISRYSAVQEINLKFGYQSVDLNLYYYLNMLYLRLIFFIFKIDRNCSIFCNHCKIPYRVFFQVVCYEIKNKRKFSNLLHFLSFFYFLSFEFSPLCTENFHVRWIFIK